MIGTSTAEFIFIRACVLLLHWTAPLSILYTVAAATYLPSAARLPKVIELWLAAETLFFALFFLPYRWHLQHAAVHPPARSAADRRKLWERVHATIDNPETYVRGWFLGATLDDIGRDDLKSFLTWAFFDRDYIEGRDVDEIEEYTQEVELLLGRHFRPGTGTAKALRLTLDPVDVLHRSLMWYACVGFVDFLTFVKLQRSGFHLHRPPLARFFTLFPLRPYSLLTSHCSPAKHLSYWHRPHTSKTRLPVLFIHGIGIGLYPYTNFLSDLNAHIDDKADAADGHVGILAVEIMSVSFRLTDPALSRPVMCAELQQILAAHGYDRFVLVSHSYGSVISTHILDSPVLRPMVASVLLIDPVSVLLHMPDVAYNFTRRKPYRANEWQLWYFASKDPGVAHALGRHFFWSENALWKDDIDDFIAGGGRVTVSIGGRDLIVNTNAVGKYLVGNVTPPKGAATNGHANGYTNGHTNGHANGHAADNADGQAKGTVGRTEKVNVSDWKHRAWSGHGLEVIWFENLDHAQVFDKPATRARLVKVVRNYCQAE